MPKWDSKKNGADGKPLTTHDPQGNRAYVSREQPSDTPYPNTSTYHNIGNSNLHTILGLVFTSV